MLKKAGQLSCNTGDRLNTVLRDFYCIQSGYLNN